MNFKSDITFKNLILAALGRAGCGVRRRAGRQIKRNV